MAATATTASSSPQGPAASDDKIQPKLLRQLEQRSDVDFWIYFGAKAQLSKSSAIEDWNQRGAAVARELRQAAAESQAAVKKQLDAANIDYQAFWATNAIKVTEGSLDLAQQVATRAEVDSLWPSFEVQPPKPMEGENAHEAQAVEWGIANINADDVWNEYGVRGEGIVVASIDSGVDYDHPALVNQYRGNNADGTFDHNYNWFDAAGQCADAPCDIDADFSHGTHTMGTMVGDDGAGNQIGVAPKATWIAANGCCPNDAALIASGEWMLEPTDLNGENADASKRPNIINNSWGSRFPSNAPFMEDISAAWAASGMFGAWANGNSGDACETSGSPGSRIINYSAGAYDINNEIADFSGRGPGQDGEIKPNISAPGVNVRSAEDDGGYRSLGGTSMASPHLAGAVALLWSAAPGVATDIDATRSLLNGTATDHPDDQCGGTDADNNVYGEGQLDAMALLDAAPVGETGTLAGTVTDAATGDPIVGAEVTMTGPITRTVVTDGNGAYSVTLSTGDYQVTARAFGYVEKTAPANVAVDTTTTRDFALEPAPSVSVGGTVTDGGGHSWPLYAKITIDGVPGVYYTNPVNGRYSIEVPAGGTYEFTVTAQYPGYQTVVEDVVVGAGNVTQDFGVGINAESCDAPGYDWASDGEFEAFRSTGTPDGWTVEDNLGNGQVWRFDDPGGRGNLTGGDGGFAVVDSDEYGSSGEQDTSLVSPVVDLTDVAEPVIRFQQDHNQINEIADVDLSLDGGATWENVLRQEEDNRSTLTEIPIPQAAGDSDVQVRFHYYEGSFDWWWQVDDVLIGSVVTCDPVNAGLVVGHVGDQNTGDYVNGATVTHDDSGASVETMATPDDSGLADGFYWMVSEETGSQPFTASADSYVSDTATVDVEPDWATEADFQLGAGMLTVDAESLDATIRLGGSATRTFNVTNEGTAPAQVDLSAGGGDFEMLGGDHGSATTLRYTDEVSDAAKDASQASKPRAQPDLKGDGPSFGTDRGSKAGKSRTPALPKTPANAVTLTHSVSQEIVQFNSVSCNSALGNADNGFLRTFDLQDFDISSDFNVTEVSFGVESATVTQPMAVKLYTLDGEFVYDNMTLIGSTETTLEAQELSMVTVPVSGTAPAGSTLVVELDSPNLQDIGGFFFPGSNNLGQTAPSYLRSEGCSIPEPTPTDEIGFPEMHLVMNVTGETGGPEWMSVDPETMTLDPGESAEVTVDLDGDVDQPGTYSGRVGLADDTPYQVDPVGVTMNITPPVTWGKVTGVVNGADCDGASAPLEDATVQMSWWSGDLTLFTNGNGRYAYWLDARGNPYTVIVAKDGYQPTVDDLRIKRGKTVTANFNLRSTGC